MTYTRQEMDSPVLIVEPYADFRAEIAETLSRLHYRCDSVASVSDALLRIRDRSYVSLVIDLEQAGRAEELLASFAVQKIVLITEDEVPDERYRTLRKPFDSKALLAILSR